MIDPGSYDIEKQLNVDKDEVEELLIGLILEGKVEGRIDQVAMRLELDTKLACSVTLDFATANYLFTGTVSKRSGMQPWTIGQVHWRRHILLS